MKNPWKKVKCKSLYSYISEHNSYACLDELDFKFHNNQSENTISTLDIITSVSHVMKVFINFSVLIKYGNKKDKQGSSRLKTIKFW